MQAKRKAGLCSHCTNHPFESLRAGSEPAAPQALSLLRQSPSQQHTAQLVTTGARSPCPFPRQTRSIIRQMRTPPPGFHSSSVYHMALSSWAPLTDNERRQPVRLQAEHSAFYRLKHVSGVADCVYSIWVSIQYQHNTFSPQHPFCSHLFTVTVTSSLTEERFKIVALYLSHAHTGHAVK